PGVARDAGGHAPDRSRAGDEDVLADQIKGKRGVGGIAERIEARNDFHRDARIRMPDVGDGNGEIFREAAGAVDTDALRARAEVAAAGQAVPAAAADEVPFAADDVARVEIVDMTAD